MELDFKKFVESYRCRICKTPLTLDNFGGLGPNHGIFCKDCYDTDERLDIGKAFEQRNHQE